MNLIEWINNVTRLNKTTMDRFQNNIKEAIDDVENLVINDGMPIGSGCDYYGTTAPENYMFADGSAISRTTYAELFSIIGTTYGSGDGSTTFNLPDKRERVSVMYKENSTNGTTGATLGTLGAKGGEFKHTQTISEIATHSHSDILVTGIPVGINASGGTSAISVSGNQSGNLGNLYTGATGSSHPMNIMQPYLVCNYIIKVK